MRKKLQDIDCLTQNIVLATSFDWRELSNRLSSAGFSVPTTSVGFCDLPQSIYRMSHAVCHGNTGFAQSINDALDKRYQEQVNQIAAMEISEVCSWIHRVSLKSPALAGVIWALATDERDGLERILRVFVQQSVTLLFRSIHEPPQHVNFEKDLSWN